MICPNQNIRLNNFYSYKCLNNSFAFNMYIKRQYRKSSNYDLTLNMELEEIIIGLGDLYAEKIKRLILDCNLNNLLKIRYILNIYIHCLK